MKFQTTKRDLIAGWRRFSEWESFTIADARTFETTAANDFLYFADWSQVANIDELDDNDINRDVSHKISFMREYLSLRAIESVRFEQDVQAFLSFQSRVAAPNLLGFWFWQSDIARFGAGLSANFQETQMSIFAGDETGVDFADTYAVVPYDCILVRNPFELWTNDGVRKLEDRLIWDLNFDGIDVSINSRATGDLLWINVVADDLGIKVTG